MAKHKKKKVKNKKVKIKMKNEKNEKEMSGTINTPDYIQIPFKRCNICNKTGHISSSCYSHPNLGTLNINTANYCLLCKSRKHVAKECNMYPKTSLNIKGCTLCMEKRIFAMHPSDLCHGVDDTYQKYMIYKSEIINNTKKKKLSLINDDPIKISEDNIIRNEIQQNVVDFSDKSMTHKHSIIGDIKNNILNILISTLTTLIQTIIFICLLIHILIEKHIIPKNNIFLYIGVTLSFFLVFSEVVRFLKQKAFAFWRRKNKKTIS